MFQDSRMLEIGTLKSMIVMAVSGIECNGRPSGKDQGASN
jgi:hypothetical protein